MSRQRAVLVALFTLVVAFVAVAPAAAGRRWCEIDPVFQIAGRQVNVVTAIPEEYQSAVTGPVAVTLYVPSGVEALLISTDAGYNGYGEVVSIVPVSWLSVTARGVQALVEVTVPISRSDVPVQVFVTPDGSRTFSSYGQANSNIPVVFVVQPAA
jgi:hypothetical protein